MSLGCRRLLLCSCGMIADRAVIWKKNGKEDHGEDHCVSDDKDRYNNLPGKNGRFLSRSYLRSRWGYTITFNARPRIY